MTRVRCIIFLSLLSISAHAQTYIAGTVSGTWSTGGSPYIVTGDILVADGTSLVIEPGVNIMFDGWYQFNVKGLLSAIGTASDSIVFTHNHPDSVWNGIRFDRADPNCRLEFCKIEYGSCNSNHGGGIYCNETSLILKNCQISDNSCGGALESGAGLYGLRSTILIDQCSFLRNKTYGSWGAGMRLSICNVHIHDSDFIDNFADSREGGALSTYRSSVLCYWTRFINNRADYGGDVLYTSDDSETSFINCLAVQDHSPYHSTVQAVGLAQVKISSSIFSNARVSGIIAVDVTYSNIQYSAGDVLEGIGNINADPLFVDPANNDYHLLAGSSCVDAGPPMALHNDWDGSRNDMGCYGGSGLAVRPTQFDYGSLGIGQAKTIDLFICNMRDESFDISSAQLSDDVNFHSDFAAPSLIQSMESDTIALTFEPVVAGNHSCDFVLQSSDITGASSATITLQGLGGVWSGPVSGVWDVDRSPYIIGGDIIVPVDETLTIDPGVVVQIDTSIAGGSARFIVEGSLFANGTENDSILFTVMEGQKGPGAWAGIDLLLQSENDLAAGMVETEIHMNRALGNNRKTKEETLIRNPLVCAPAATGTAHLSYCRVEYGTIGIKARDDNIIIEHCLVQKNSGTGVTWLGDEHSADGQLSHSQIKDNGTWGVLCAAYCEQNYGSADPTIDSNIIRNNAAGGISIRAVGDGPYSWSGTIDYAYANPVVQNNSIQNNGGPAIQVYAAGEFTEGIPLDHKSYARAKPLLSKNIVSNNADGLKASAPVFGSTLKMSESSVDVDRCTFWANGTTEASAIDSATITINNSIFWQTNGIFYTATSGEIAVTYSDLDWSHPGTGNIQENPQFINPFAGDFSLAESSPCIDAGDPTSAKDPDSTRADMGALYFFQSSGKVEQEIPLSNGWNWFSLNVEDEDKSLNTVLASLEHGTFIKNQTSFATYYGGTTGWYSSNGLDDMDVKSMYMIKMADADVLQYEGFPVDPLNTTIQLSQGWNWIGYVPQLPISLNDALASLSPNGAFIKNQTSFSTYYGDPTGWYSSNGLEQMIPGDGYMLRMDAADELIYPASSAVPTLKEHICKKKSIWTVPYQQYEHSMAITALLLLGEKECQDPDMLVGAFVGEECRGVGFPVLFPLNGRHVFAMLVYGRADETMTFKAYDSQRDVVMKVDTKIPFKVNGILGNGLHPYLFKAPSESMQEIPTSYHLYHNFPNPFNPVTTIAYDLPEPGQVRLDIYDIRGQLVRALEDGERVAGHHEVTWDGCNGRGLPVGSGLYLCRLKCGEFESMRKMILTR